MRAITYSSLGAAAAVLVEEEVATPQPQSGEVLVRLHASAVNPSDVKVRAGQRSGASAMPFPKIIPHSDGAGVIEAVGDNVDEKRIGERVWIWNGQWKRAFGTAAEYICVTQDQAVPLPASTSFETGAALGIPGLTACHCIFGDGDISDKTILISGGGGTVGNLAVQMAHAGGARVLATASGEDNIKRVKSAGADHVFDYKNPNLADEILDATGGSFIDRIIEVEFGKNADTNAKVIKENGRIISFGSAQDMTPTLPFYPLLFKAVKLEFVLVYLLTADQRKKAISRLHRLLNADQLQVPVQKIYDLSDCAAAHQAVEAGSRSGTVVLKI